MSRFFFSFPWIIALAICGCVKEVHPAASLSNAGDSAQFSSPNKGLMTLVVQDDECTEEDWKEDYLVVILKNSSGSEVTRYPFCSSYGLFSLEAIDLNGDGFPEFVLIDGSGRGTNARKEQLHVLIFKSGKIDELLATPYSAPLGPSGNWWYEHSYNRLNGTRRVEINLRLMHTDDQEDWLEAPPSIEFKRIRVDGM